MEGGGCGVVENKIIGELGPKRQNMHAECRLVFIMANY